MLSRIDSLETFMACKYIQPSSTNRVAAFDLIHDLRSCLFRPNLGKLQIRQSRRKLRHCFALRSPSRSAQSTSTSHARAVVFFARTQYVPPQFSPAPHIQSASLSRLVCCDPKVDLPITTSEPPAIGQLVLRGLRCSRLNSPYMRVTRLQ